MCSCALVKYMLLLHAEFPDNPVHRRIRTAYYVQCLYDKRKPCVPILDVRSMNAQTHRNHQTLQTTHTRCTNTLTHSATATTNITTQTISKHITNPALYPPSSASSSSSSTTHIMMNILHKTYRVHPSSFVCCIHTKNLDVDKILFAVPLWRVPRACRNGIPNILC